MTEDRLRSYGVFLLRVALGTMFIAHSTIYMLMTLTLAGTGQFFVAGGRAGALADPNGCDLGSFRKRLALCRHQRWLGVPPLPLRSLQLRRPCLATVHTRWPHRG